MSKILDLRFQVDRGGEVKVVKTDIGDLTNDELEKTIKTFRNFASGFDIVPLDPPITSEEVMDSVDGYLLPPGKKLTHVVIGPDAPGKC